MKNPEGAALSRLLAAYRKETGFRALATAADGRKAGGRLVRPGAREAWRRQVVAEALRWGEPCVMLDGEGLAAWGVPLMRNSRLTGGILVEGVPLESGNPRELSARIHAAAGRLLEMVQEAGLTNVDHLAARREESRRQRERAEAIHTLKDGVYDGIRTLYLREEPGLLAAIKRGERPAAREIINRVLVGIYHISRSRPELLKSLVLELVVMMARSAVEAGADPAEVLGANYEGATVLARLSDDEEISVWLRGMLERIMDAIRDHRRFPNAVLLSRALAHMREHLAEPLDRDTVARAAGLSGSHFSHLMREQTGSTFTDLMTQFRVDRACELLRRTDKSLVQIAMECGFGDQSYFSRVFKRATGATPRAYREAAP